MDAKQRFASAFVKFGQSCYAVPALLALITLALFARVLFASVGTVISNPTTDIAQQFIYYRQFGFDALRHGHLALWTPYIFSGCPFLGNWQSALLYPPNVIYLILPVAKAIDLDMALHVFIAGLGVSIWVRRSGASRLASVLAAAMVMFGAPYFMHIYAGHITMIDAMAWVPWLLIAVDALLDHREPRWILLGIGALALQVLAGHPQTVYNTLVALFLYVVFQLIQTPKRWPVLGLFALMGFGAALLSGAQIVAGLQAASDGVRSGGVSYAFAGSLSFPPENFLTFLVPSFFGNMASSPYLGRWYLWEMDIFLGTAGITLAVFGALRAQASRKWIWIVMSILLLWIALAANTPLFYVLYHFVPGFNKFRSDSKFIYQATLFISMLAAFGIDALRTNAKTWARWLALGAVIIAAALIVFALLLDANGSLSKIWLGIIGPIYSSHQWFASPQTFLNGPILAVAQSSAAIYCLIAACMLALLAILLFFLPKRPKLIYAIVALGVLEVVVYANATIETFNVAQVAPPAGEMRFLAAHPGDYRVLQQAFPVNEAYETHVSDIWGYDPTVLNRYAQFLFYAEGRNPNTASIYLNFSKPSRLLQIVRCRYIFSLQPNQRIGFYEFKHPLPHALIVSRWKTLVGRDQIFAALSDKSFDPAQTAILETTDVAMPAGAPAVGTAQITDEGPNRMRVEATVNKPSLLLITDPYSRFWHVSALPGSAQTKYTIVPADYAIMAIPVSAGHHAIEINYMPNGFTAALWVSGIGWIAFIGACVFVGLTRRNNY